ncbi:MAG: transcription antitermination protein [Haloferacaceae archaeon]
MDGDTFLERLRDDFETELSRLNSSKALYAVTGGEMDAPSVRAAAADEAASAAGLFAAWADDESDAEAAALFADVAEAIDGEEGHRDRIGADEGTADTDGLLYETISGFDATPERVAGLLARTVVARELVSQMVGFFVGDADPRSADVFRSIRDDLDDQRDRALQVLEDVCEDEGDWDDAMAAAAAALEGAYDYYVETLEGMGVEPKNVC